MPGQKSLAEGRYYAHPRNAFWWIMSRCLQFSESLNYVERVAQLESHGVAVWDVLLDCERPGSLDSNIVVRSEVANDFPGFFKQHNTITKTLFNGAAAETIFKRHWQVLTGADSVREWRRMPSTSPAHASMTREDKLSIWHRELSN